MLWAWTWGYWIWFSLRGPFLVSRIARALFEPRKRYKAALPVYADVSVLTSVMRGLMWKGDRLGGALDIISRPERVQKIIDDCSAFVERAAPTLPDWKMGNQASARWEATALFFSKVRSFDCDDFAIYAANTIEASRNPVFVSVNWVGADRRWHGHAVCCFLWREGYAFISNQHGCEAQVANAAGQPLGSVADCVRALVGEGRLIGYAVATPDLQLRAVVRGGR